MNYCNTETFFLKVQFILPSNHCQRKLSQTYSFNFYTGDSLGQFHAGLNFSTPDNDNDNTPANGVTTNCAWYYHSGWWFDYCLHANLNGVYLSNYLADFNEGIQWEEWTTYHNVNTTGLDMNRYSMKTATMKIRKNVWRLYHPVEELGTHKDTRKRISWLKRPFLTLLLLYRYCKLRPSQEISVIMNSTADRVAQKSCPL